MRVLLVLVCLLVLVTSAGAECAWVLWEEVEDTHFSPYQTTVEWRISWSADSRNECEGALKGGLRAEIAQWSKTAKELPESYDFTSTEIGQMWTLRQKNFSSRTKRYICLPDTVDPRGPKGK